MSRLTQDSALPHPLARTGLSPSAAAISNAFRFASSGNPCGPITPPLPKQRRFGLLPFRSPLLGESRLFSSPAGTKMFQFPAFACLAACRAFNAAGSPIRTPADQWSFAPTRGFSQLVASFFASWSLGIHHTPLFICSIRDFLIPKYNISVLLDFILPSFQHVKELHRPSPGKRQVKRNRTFSMFQIPAVS